MPNRIKLKRRRNRYDRLGDTPEKETQDKDNSLKRQTKRTKTEDGWVELKKPPKEGRQLRRTGKDEEEEGKTRRPVQEDKSEGGRTMTKSKKCKEEKPLKKQEQDQEAEH